jgi:PKD repeat protein
MIATSRRLLSWVLPLSLVLALFPLSIATANDITVSIAAPDEVAQGSNFTARVNITQVTNFDTCQFKVTYNNSVIQVIGVEGGPQGVSAGIIDSTAVPIDNWAFSPPGTPGTVFVLGNVVGAPGVNGTGYLAEIHFHVVGSVCNTSNITLSEGMLFDNMSDEIPVSHWLGDSVHVSQALSVTGCMAIPNPTSVGHNSTFSANATGGTGNYTWLWDFGDGSNSTQANPIYAYGGADIYAATVTVKDALNNTQQCSFNITVNESLVANFSADSGIVRAYPSGNSTIDPEIAYPTCGYVNSPTNTTFNFSNQGTGGMGAYTYAWDFGDGNNSTDENPVHSYAVNATYNVSLTVTDSLLDSDTKTKVDYLMAYKAGDANANGIVDMADVTKVERIILGIDLPTIWGDANQNSIIDMGDVTKIERIILGID